MYRIAGNLHLASGETNLIISESTMENAIEMGRYFRNHARYSFVSAVGETEFNQAKEVLGIIHKISQTTLATRREVYRSGGNRLVNKTEELCPILDLLEDYGYIKQVRAPHTVGGTKPSDLIFLHPNYIPKLR